MWRRAAGDRRRGNVRLLLGMLAIDAVVLGALYWTDRPQLVYSRSVPELLADAGALQFRPLRVDGVLVPGSLYRVKDRCEFRFRLASTADPSVTLDVRYPMDVGYPGFRRKCGLPDTFCDAPGFDFTASVEGTLEYDASGVYFTGVQVMARCPGKYETIGGKRPAPCPPIPLRT